MPFAWLVSEIVVLVEGTTFIDHADVEVTGLGGNPGRAGLVAGTTGANHDVAICVADDQIEDREPVASNLKVGLLTAAIQDLVHIHAAGLNAGYSAAWTAHQIGESQRRNAQQHCHTGQRTNAFHDTTLSLG